MALRAAVVGCGALANGAHLPNLAASEQFELLVACDRRQEAAQAAAERWGAKETSEDWHEVTAHPDVDLIVLCTHTNLRAPVITEALRQGKPVYTEKPLAATRAESLEILRASRETGVPVCVGHNRRSSPAVLEFRRLIETARAKGADRPASIDRNTGKRDALAEEASTQLLLRVNDDIRTWKLWIFEDDEGIILAEMVHFIDLALWLVPSPPCEVYASGSPRGNFTELIRFADGSQATLQHSMVGNFDYPKELMEASLRNVTIAMDHHLEVRQRGMETEPFRTYFPLGGAEDLADKQGIEAFHEACDRLRDRRQAGDTDVPAMVGVNKGHADQLERFGRHIQGQGENPCPVESAVVVNNVALKLLQSARLGLPVKVGPEDYDLVYAQRE